MRNRNSPGPRTLPERRLPGLAAAYLGALASLLAPPSDAWAADIMPGAPVSDSPDPAAPDTQLNSEVSVEAEPPAQTTNVSDPVTPLGSVFVDPLGFALFGPRFGAELGSRHLTGSLYGRWLGLGALSRGLFLNPGDSFGFSFGAGLRGRYYIGEKQDKVHLGLAVEYLHTRVEGKAQRVATVQGYLVPLLEGGYRFAWPLVYLDIAAGLGYAKRVSAKMENLPGGSNARFFQPLDESSVYGTASLDVGIVF